MTKIRKQQRKKRYRYVNKKNIKRRRKLAHSVQCPQIKIELEKGKSLAQNMSEMGLAFDVNKSLGIAWKNESKSTKEQSKGNSAHKGHVAEEMEAEANALRVRKLRLPATQVRRLSHLITKYGEDYKAMSRDPKNHYQETWKQIRAKIKIFKSIPEQYNEFLKSQAPETVVMDIDNCV